MKNPVREIDSTLSSPPSLPSLTIFFTGAPVYAWTERFDRFVERVRSSRRAGRMAESRALSSNEIRDRDSAFANASLGGSSRDRVNARPRGCALRRAESGCEALSREF
jgi:hypothetical protein